MLEVGWMDGDDRIKNIQETQLQNITSRKMIKTYDKASS